MSDEHIDEAAKILWDYLQLHQEVVKSDAIFVLCSMDTRVAERGAELFKQGLGDYLIISGGSGKLTENVFDKSEAQELSYADYFNKACPRELVLNVMVGDMQRIKEYADQDYKSNRIFQPMCGMLMRGS